MKQLLILFFIVITGAGFSQSVPTPGAPQSQPILLKNATIHVGNGKVIENGSILFSDGKIVKVGKNISANNALVKDATGKHIYPGLIAPNTIMGLSEIEALRQTKDFDEVGENNANIRSIIAYNTDSRVTPTVRSNGILLAQVAPKGGYISGTSSVVQLDAWNWEDAVVKLDDGLFLNWPRSTVYRWSSQGYGENKKYSGELNAIKTYFQEAKAYAVKNPTKKNLRFEGMEGIFNGKKKLFIRVNAAKDIISSVNFAKQLGIKPVIVGGSESYLITDFLKENNISVILGGTHSLPRHDDEAVDLPYRLPSILQEAGINYCLSYLNFWEVRNLPFQAGTAVAYGLTKEQALSSITLNTAKILGIDDKVGSLEVGKQATLIVTEGDVLDMATSNVIDAYIDGRQMDIGNKQKDLYKKFGKKLGQPVKLPNAQN